VEAAVGARALIVLALLAGCAGPRPSVDRVEVAASPQPGCVRVSIELQNHGGAGEVEVEITLRDAGARIDAHRDVTLERDAHVLFVADVEAPPGQWVAEVTAQYPP
jgi:hypothetical protein